MRAGNQHMRQSKGEQGVHLLKCIAARDRSPITRTTFCPAPLLTQVVTVSLHNNLEGDTISWKKQKRKQENVAKQNYPVGLKVMDTWKLKSRFAMVPLTSLLLGCTPCHLLYFWLTHWAVNGLGREGNWLGPQKYHVVVWHDPIMSWAVSLTEGNTLEHGQDKEETTWFVSTGCSHYSKK